MATGGGCTILCRLHSIPPLTHRNPTRHWPKKLLVNYKVAGGFAPGAIALHLVGPAITSGATSLLRCSRRMRSQFFSKFAPISPAKLEVTACYLDRSSNPVLSNLEPLALASILGYTT
ncbi:hypothetical protein Fot_34795 [Forsythia ovata]|uniref:Uncharacterized protein n=1 Tax=Forsythia ovata TaxID=205694 RepID=A0ABD1SMR7_9LAMI